MLIEAQVALYPMTDSFAPVIASALKALDAPREGVRIEIDEISILMVGLPAGLFLAMRDLYVAMAASGVHSVLHAILRCPAQGIPAAPPAGRIEPAVTGEAAAARFSLVVGERDRRVFRPLRGDAGQVFATLADLFCRLGPPGGLVALDLTVSANSPAPD